MNLDDISEALGLSASQTSEAIRELVEMMADERCFGECLKPSSSSVRAETIRDPNRRVPFVMLHDSRCLGLAVSSEDSAGPTQLSQLTTWLSTQPGAAFFREGPVCHGTR